MWSRGAIIIDPLICGVFVPALPLTGDALFVGMERYEGFTLNWVSLTELGRSA